MTVVDSPAYASDPSARDAYAVVRQAARDALGGMTGQAIEVACEGRRLFAPDDLAVQSKNVLVELQFEWPVDFHHGLVVLADAADLTRLFELPPGAEDEIIAAEALLSLGDIVSTFLDSVVGELVWLRPAPRAWLANMEPIAAEAPASGEGGLRVELPSSVAGDEPLYATDVTVAGADGVPCGLVVVFGEQAERALLGLRDGAGDTAMGSQDALTHDDVDSGEGASFDEPARGRGEMEGIQGTTPGRADVTAAGRDNGPVQPARFKPLGSEQAAGRGHSIDLIKDVPLHVSVELGRASMTVREVLALGPGSVVQLDRLAGEPVDILVNDRLIAHGEVVIVDESFGVRITEIVRDAGRRGGQ